MHSRPMPSNPVKCLLGLLLMIVLISLMSACTTGGGGGKIGAGTSSSGSPISIIGAEVHPRLALSPTSINFGDVPVGFSVSQVVTLRNSGNATVMVMSATITGAGFSHDLTPPFSLAAGEFRSFNLSFNPMAAGSVMGMLSIVSDAENTPTVLTLSGNGVGPGPGSLTVSPTSITFGDTVVGTAATQTATLVNNGGTTVTVSSVMVTGAGFSAMGVATPLTVDPGQTVSFTVQFFPVATGAAAGSITIVSDAPNSPASVTLAGNGVAPVKTLSVSPTSIDFGDVTVGSNSTQAVMVTNTGNVNVTISASNVTGTGFSINPPLTLPLVLTPGQTTNFNVRFAPASTGAVAGNVSLTSDATNSPTMVSLMGNATPAPIGQLTASPTSIDFGSVIVGSTTSQPVTISNTGNANLNVTAANVTGAGFSINPALALPLTLTPGQSTSFTVRFAPASAGAVAGSVSLVNNGATTPVMVTLSGTGVAQVLQLDVSPSSIDFGDVNTGSMATQSVMMTNSGNVNLSVTAANVTGAGFSINPPLTLPVALTPGQSASFTVQFAPTGTGAVSGSVSLVSNATNSPTMVTLNGNGTTTPVATLNASPTSLDFGNVIVGSTTSQLVTITNVGNASATIMTSSISGAGFSVSGLALPLTLTPGQSTNFTVQFMPASAGNVTGNVTLNSNAGNTPHVISLMGTGIAQVLQLNVNPMSIDFGSVTVGNMSTMSGAVQNIGNVSVTISSTSVTGTAFSFNPAFATPTTLTPGQSVGFTLQFAPGAAASFSESASFISNASNSPTSLTIMGTGLAAPTGLLDLNPTMIDYGMVVVGNPRDMAVSLTNSGAANVTITAANVTGADFSITPALTLPLTLMPGQSTTFNARFSPASAGNISGNISIVSDAANSPTVLTLAGTGVAQVLQLSVSPTSINFGDVTVGGMGSQSVTLTNAGNVDLTITQANVTGAAFSTIGLTVPLTLTPGQSSNFTARFSPSATGTVSGNLSIVSNATNSPTAVTLSGNGTPAPIGMLTTSPASINFGSVIVGNTNSQMVTLTNTGTASLMVTSSMVTGAGFSITGLTTPLTLSVGQSTSFTARFMPASAGAVSGSISLANDGSTSPVTVSLSGTGVAQVLQLNVSPTSINFGNVTTGMSAGQMVTMTNAGNVNLNVTAANVSGAGFSINPPLALPLTLTPGQTANFTAQFAPSVTGMVNGSISIVSNATNSPTAVTLSGTGTPPPIGTLIASPTSINFGSVIVGNMNSQTVTLMNTGTASLMITSSSVTGAGLSITGLALPLTLNVGQSTSFTARFMPASAGAVAGNISLVNTGSVTPVMVSLSGTGVAQVKTLSASPTSINFGNVTVGMTSSQMVTVTNTGNVNVNVMSSMVTGAGFSTTGLAPPLTLTPGQSTTFTARFMPSVTGSVSGNISLTSDATNSPTVVTLMGNGTPVPIGTLTASPTSINFGSVIVGSSSSPSTVTLTNTGTASLTISSVTPSNAAFQFTNPLQLTLAAGASTTMTVTFAPSAAGAIAGNISLANTGSVTPVMVSLSGTGVAQVKTLSASPTSIDFGNVTLGSSSMQMISVTNTGNVGVTISSSSVTGTGFSASGLTLPLTLNAGQSTTFNVAFSPPVSGGASGNVSLTGDASNSPTSVTLSGTGVVPLANLTISPLSINFGDVVIGGQASQAVTLLNANATSITVNNIVAAGTGFSVLAFDPNADPNLPPPPTPFPFMLFPGQSTSFAVSFMPTTGGPSSGSATVTSSAGNSPATVTLMGNGVVGVILAWDASASVVVGYEVLRATKSGGPYTLLNATPVAATTYTDTTVTSGQTFFYAVRAVDAIGQKSALSNEIMVTLP